MRDVLLKYLMPVGVTCIACGEMRKMDSVHALCPKCREKLESTRVPAAACDRCLSYVAPGESCRFCKDGGMGAIAFSYAPYMYTGVARRLVTRLKFDSVNEALEPLCNGMAQALKDREMDLVVPVPLHRYRERYRGCNQAMLLAMGVAARTGLQVQNALVRTRQTRPQTALISFRQRNTNVKDAFLALPDAQLKGKRILLVDDVRTSGSTARACAKALMDAGAKQVSLLTACVVYQYHGKNTERKMEEEHGGMAGKNGAAAGQ